MSGIAQLFSRRDAHPIVIDIALLSVFGPEWVSWDGDSTILAISRQFNPPSRQTQQRVYALGVLHSNHAYWEDWRAFELCSWGLGGQVIDLSSTHPLTAYPLVYGNRVAKWIDPAAQLSEEVQTYIISVFITEQFSLLPIDFASLQPRLFSVRPELRERADQVRAALANGAPGASLEDESTDLIAVEVARHKVLDTMLRTTCTPAAITAQAKTYGLEALADSLFKEGG